MGLFRKRGKEEDQKTRNVEEESRRHRREQLMIARRLELIKDEVAIIRRETGR